MAANEDRIKVIETFACPDGKVKPTIALLGKIDVSGKTLIVVWEKDSLVTRATNNLQGVKAVQAKYLNVYDIMNSEHLIISKKSLDIIQEWLGEAK